MFHDMFVYQSGLGREQGTKIFIFAKFASEIHRWIRPASLQLRTVSFLFVSVPLQNPQREEQTDVFHDVFVY